MLVTSSPLVDAFGDDIMNAGDENVCLTRASPITRRIIEATPRAAIRRGRRFPRRHARPPEPLGSSIAVVDFMSAFQNIVCRQLSADSLMCTAFFSFYASARCGLPAIYYHMIMLSMRRL